MIFFINVLFIFTKVLLAFLLLPFVLVLNSKKRDSVIIGTRNGNDGFDNGEIYFSYMQTKFKGNVYFIKNKLSNSEDKDFLKKNEVMTIILILLSNKIYVTHSESDVLDYFWRFLIFKKFIFIQHGVIGIKKLPEYERKNFSAIVSSCEYETNILINNFNINQDNIIKSGIPRFDSYSVDENIKRNIKSCFIMFTWRKNYKFNQSVIVNEIVTKLLDYYSELVIYVCIHENSNLYEADIILNPRVIYVNNKSIQHVICNTDLLLTDFSSISWDYLYQNKQICFIRYDYEMFSEYEGVYYQDDDFFGHFEQSVNDIDSDFLNKVYDSNQKNNNKFVVAYPFYYRGSNNHCEMLIKLTEEIT